MTQQKIIRDDEGSYDLFSSLKDREFLVYCTACAPENFPAPVFLRRFAEEIQQEKHWFKHVRFPQLAVELILAGKMEFFSENHHSIAGPGTLCLIPPGESVLCSCQEGSEVRKISAIFGGENLKSFLITLQMMHCRAVQLAEPESFEQKMRSLTEIVQAPAIENSIKSYAFLLELAGMIGEDNSWQTPFQRAVAVMTNNICEDLPIPVIAAKAGISKSTLCRMFKAELHCSPLEYLNMLRLKFAAGKLQRTSLPVKEIAQRCGFSSSSRFCTVFLNRYHVPPNVYRKQYIEQSK